MKNIKIFFGMNLFNTPWGGGNQFLKVLKKEFDARNQIVNVPEESDIILFNSHHNYKKIIEYKKKFDDKKFIHRIDGPMIYRGKQGLKTDNLIFLLNKYLADGSIYQSNWSQNQNHLRSCYINNFEKVINNACDNDIFYKKNNLY